jgi:hypothetical protein
MPDDSCAPYRWRSCAHLVATVLILAGAGLTLCLGAFDIASTS